MVKILKRLSRKLLKPAVLKKMVVSGTMAPRQRKPENGMPCVLRAGGDREALKGIFAAWGDLFAPGMKVLIKININTANPYPASTSPDMLAGLVEILYEYGIRDIAVGDCSSVRVVPTRRVVGKTGILPAIAGKAEFVCFDDGPWVSVPVGGRYLPQVTVPRLAMEADRIVYLANMKTHHHAHFSFGLKLAVGFMHPMERFALHSEHLEEKAAEINLAVAADLIVVDGRAAFITGGPDTGRIEKPGVVLAGTNPLAVDVEAYKTVLKLKKQYGCLEGFKDDPFAMAQLRHARELGLGGIPWRGYEVKELQEEK
jgi:uncharacterized protein (DUF362 family)